MDYIPQLFANRTTPSFYNSSLPAIGKQIASISYGEVGSYVIAGTTATISAGATLAGSTLRRSASDISLNSSLGTNGNIFGTLSTPVSLNLSGTWRALTNVGTSNGSFGFGLFVRIA